MITWIHTCMEINFYPHMPSVNFKSDRLQNNTSWQNNLWIKKELSIIFTLFVIFFFLTNLTTKQSPSWEANGHSAIQQITRLLLNTKIHDRVHKSPQNLRPYVTVSSMQVFTVW